MSDRGELLRLDFYGVRVAIHGDPVALDLLREHFLAFASAAGDDPAVRLTLERRQPPLSELGRLRADQVLERGIVYNSGSTTWVDHHGAALSRFDFATQEGCVAAPDTNDLVELAYLMVHARLGPLLERRGLVRVHSLGFAHDGGATLLLTPSGGGKSRLAVALLNDRRVTLLGDDMVLVDRHANVYPFPQPPGVSSPEHVANLGPVIPFSRRHHGLKYILKLEAVRDRFATSALPARWIVLAHRVSRPPSRLADCSRRQAAAALWRDAVVGLGLPQVIELLARRGASDLWTHAPAAWQRARCAFALLRRARATILEVAEPETAASLLANLPE